MYDEEINSVLYTLLQKQDEMLVLMKAMHGKITMPEEDVWLNRAGVMDLLCITEATFYRRQAEDKWIRKKSGGTWYYLKSSLMKNM